MFNSEKKQLTINIFSTFNYIGLMGRFECGLILVVFMLSGCGLRSSYYRYIQSYRVTSINAMAIIEDMAEEQPSFIEKRSIVVTETFWEFQNSEIGDIEFDAPNSETGSIAKGKRYYFRDIGKVIIRNKKNWIVVQVRSKRNNVLSEFYTNNLPKATKLADAFSYMKNKARYNI